VRLQEARSSVNRELQELPAQKFHGNA